MNTLLPPTVFPAVNPKSSSVNPKDFHSEQRLFSLMANAHEIGTDRFTVQVAQDRTADEQFMKQFAALLAAVLALGVAASAIIAFTVTKRGLRPLGEMTRALKRVGPKQLHERVTAVGWPRELQPLAAAFDDMLGRLEDSFVRLSQFSADIAHELRTPIGNIRGEAEVALTRARSADEYREVIESTIAECQHLGHIVDNLLFLARTEAAEGHLQRTSFDGRTAIERTAALIVMLYKRAKALGLVVDDTFLFPLTQQHIADALGLSLVHTNKTLARLRKMGMFARMNGSLTLTNPRVLERVGQYFEEEIPQRPLI